MSELLNSEQINPPQTPINWSAAPPSACSLQYCANGHTWTPQLALPHCQGCQNPLLALRQLNCPTCNEPVVKTRLRIDHLGGAHPITKACQNEYHIGPEYIIVEIDHTHSAWIAQGTQPVNPKAQSKQVYPQRLAAPAGDSPPQAGESDLDGCLPRRKSSI